MIADRLLSGSTRGPRMRTRLYLILSLIVLAVSACGSSDKADRAVPVPEIVNNNGSPTTGVLTATFDPTSADLAIPLPNNLLFLGTNDLTLNLPVDPSSPAAGAFEAINSLDGWSTVAPWATGFGGSINASTVTTGGSVRWFEVTLTGPGGATIGGRLFDVYEASPGPGPPTMLVAQTVLLANRTITP